MKSLILLWFATYLVSQVASAPYAPVMTMKDYNSEHDLDSRIISGHPAERGQFPWQVGLRMYLENGRAFCGGSLIDPGWVLTAAHCAEGVLAWTVYMGTLEIKIPNDPGSVIVNSTEGIPHEKFNSFLNNDIALIKLPENVELSDTIKPIKLPAKTEASADLDDIQVTVSGWGKVNDSSTSISPVLNYVELRTIDNAECSSTYGPLVVVSSTICAVGDPEHSTCNGDSGGPLIRYNPDGAPVQIGVVSFVHRRGCASGNPSGYVRTASYLDWINEHTGISV